MRVAIVGTGYVGLCTGAVLAELGHEVGLVDIDEERVEEVNAGQAPFHEPGLDESLIGLLDEGRLSATTDTAEALAGADVAFLCVGTPRDASGEADLSAIEQASRDVGEALDRGGELTVVVKSTVPPGTTAELVKPAVLEAADVDEAGPVSFAMNPEFLREGSALADAREPDKLVFGTTDEAALDRLERLYTDLEGTRVRVDPTTAELIKYANNALLATKVSFANELANLCDEVGADWNDVAEAVGLDDRLSGRFLRAGAGFGGSCFPKDVSAIEHEARQAGLDPVVLSAVLERNQRQPVRAVDVLEGAAGDLEAKRVALLGLSFKPGTDDVRNTRAVPIYNELVDRGAEVLVHDPEAVEDFQEMVSDVEAAETVEQALEGAHGVIVQTAWPVYAKRAPGVFVERMGEPVVVDARRALDEQAFQEADGLTYRAIGLGHAGDD